MCGVNYFSFSLLQGILSVMALDIMYDISVSRFVMGIIFAMSTIVPAVATTRPGVVISRLGLKKSFALIFFVQWVPMLLLVWTHSWAAFIAMVFLASLGDSMKVVAAEAVLRGLHIGDSSRIFGVASFSRSLGSLVAQILSFPLAALLDSGWRTVTLVFCLFTLVLGLGGLSLVRSVRFDGAVSGGPEKGMGPVKLLRALPARTRNLTLSIFLMYGGAAGLAIVSSMWLPVLLSDRGFDESSASNLAAAVTAGSIFAALTASNLFGVLTRTRRSSPFYCLTVIAALALIMSTRSFYLIWAAAFVNGAVGVLQIIQSQKFAVDIAPAGNEGQFMAMVNGVMNLFGIFALVGMGQMSSLTAQSIFIAVFAAIALAGSLWYCSCAGHNERSKI